jgi:hypothetical protein
MSRNVAMLSLRRLISEQWWCEDIGPVLPRGIAVTERHAAREVVDASEEMDQIEEPNGHLVEAKRVSSEFSKKGV